MLRQAKQRIRPLFTAPSVTASATAFLDGLRGSERRKTGWMRAEAAGDPAPWRQHAILGRTHWDAEATRNVVRDPVVETLASQDAVLLIEEIDFPKQGKASSGVTRRYTGLTSKITNWQIRDLAAYVSEQDYAFIDRRLYMPKAWSQLRTTGRRRMCQTTTPLPPSRSWRSPSSSKRFRHECR